MEKIDLKCNSCQSDKIYLFQDTITLSHHLYRVFARCANCNNEILLFQWTQQTAEINSVLKNE